MVETYRRKIQTKDPPLQTYVQAVKSVGDWIIEGYKAKIVPPSAGADALIVRDYGDTENRIRLFDDGSIEARTARITSSFAYWGAYLSLVRSPEAFFRGRTEATHAIHFQTYDGAIWQSAARLVGGYLEIVRGKLTGALDANKQSITNIEAIKGIFGNYNLPIDANRSAAYPGDALFLRTRNSIDEETSRLIITGGVDIAEIKIASSKLNLQSNKLLNPKTFTIRPALADMEVGEIAFGIGTGPAGEDEIFFKPDTTRISYWTASGTIIT